MPDRLALVKGPPAARRSHLDGFVAALRPARAEARRRYARALAQRNALIGRIRARRRRRATRSTRGTPSWRRPASELMATRAAAVETLAPLFADDRGRAGPGRARPSATRREAAPARRDELRERARRTRESDLARGFSGHGPHLDELAITVGGRPARRYASQGQQRSALLALLFAERDALLAERAEPPLMLLDDVTSELDPERRELLCERLAARRRSGARDRDRELAPAGVLRAARARGPRRRGDPRRRRRDRGGVSAARAGASRARRARSRRRSRRSAPRSRRRRSSPRCRRRGPPRPGALAAAQGDPVAERDGVVTVACRSATWAQELDLMSPILLEKLGESARIGAVLGGLEGPPIHRRRGPWRFRLTYVTVLCLFAGLLWRSDARLRPLIPGILM